jgi:hypothetical protein
MGLAALGCTLARELSGQAEIDREQVRLDRAVCECSPSELAADASRSLRKNVYLSLSERRFRTINRCC